MNIFDNKSIIINFITNNSEIIITDDKLALCIYDINKGFINRIDSIHKNNITKIKYFNNDIVISSSEDCCLNVIDIKESKIINKLECIIIR